MRASTEHSLINKHVRQHNRESGETVTWYEFIPLGTSAASTGLSSLWDDIYDEGPKGAGGRIYAAGMVLPTVYVAEFEDKFNLQDDGRQVLQNLNVTILYADAVSAGLSSPEDYEGHLNDIVFYENHWYKVSDYHVRGRLPDEVVIGVVAYEIYLDQEFPNDPGPSKTTYLDLPWPSTFPTHGV